jgi:hypothetical protein
MGANMWMVMQPRFRGGCRVSSVERGGGWQAAGLFKGEAQDGAERLNKEGPGRGEGKW